MIRFIIKRAELHSSTQGLFEDIYTLDVDVPELEQALTRGGYGENGYEKHSLLGVEVI